MRRNRAAHALLVALADIGGVWNVDEVDGRALTAFADASVRGAVGVVLTEAAALGRIIARRSRRSRRRLRLRRPGARQARRRRAELLQRHRPRRLLRLRTRRRCAEGVGADDRSTPASPSSSRACCRSAPRDGYVHRVDYRLRPDPGSTPTAVSLPSAYTYYETVGQNWERAALIKARPSPATSRSASASSHDLAPFIWRKYFDFAAIADVHAMKRQIHAVRGHDEIAVAGHDIKLGRGGIREIEFFVQTQQLVFGGRRPRLRGRRTLDMLGALHDEGWITAKARDELADGLPLPALGRAPAADGRGRADAAPAVRRRRR